MPTSPPFLSQRARRLVDAPLISSYIYEHFARLEQAYDAETRRDGYVGLCVAENRLMWAELSARLAAVSSPPHRVLGYDAMIGAWAVRERIAELLSDRICRRPIRPEHVALLAGAGSVLELLFYAIGDPGDGVLIPTPSYAGFWNDLGARNGLKIITVPTHSANGFELTEASLDRALAEASCPVRALLYTNPDNPLGRVQSRAQVERVLAWAERNGLHVVFDEIYALSTFGSQPFTSVASLRPMLGDRAHVVWAFSKDFGASGLRSGVLVTENELVMQTVDALSYFSACSGHTQHLLAEIVSDRPWLDDYLATHVARLRQTYAEVTAVLERFRVPFLPANSGIFVVCDLRGYLDSPTAEAESALWQRLLDDANVNLTPGSACRIDEPGFFRLCWATSPRAATMAGVERLGRTLATIKASGSA